MPWTLFPRKHKEYWEADTQKPVEDVAITQEPTAEMEHSKKSILVDDTHEPLDDIVVTQEPIVEAEVNQG